MSPRHRDKDVWLRYVRPAIGAFAFTLVLTLAGCASSPDPPLTDSVNAVVGVTDADMCAAIGDVVAITFNADSAAQEGRLTVQEQRSWNRLATRALDRVATSGQGAVSEAVADLQAAVPPIAAGSAATARIESEAAYRAVLGSCASAGSEVETWSFTGVGQIVCVRGWCLRS